MHLWHLEPKDLDIMAYEEKTIQAPTIPPFNHIKDTTNVFPFSLSFLLKIYLLNFEIFNDNSKLLHNPSTPNLWILGSQGLIFPLCPSSTLEMARGLRIMRTRVKINQDGWPLTEDIEPSWFMLVCGFHSSLPLSISLCMCKYLQEGGWVSKWLCWTERLTLLFP